jgi:hypothetical protein
MDNTPDEFKCPITLEIMVDPVLCDDGYTYERSAIMSMRKSISPMTRQPIDKSKIIPNRALKNAILRFKESTGVSGITIQPKNNLMSQIITSRMSALDIFERKQKDIEISRREQIDKERREKERLKQIEKERQEKIRQEDIQLQRAVNMFNAEDVPSFIIGKEVIHYSTADNDRSGQTYPSWTCNSEQQYIFDLNMFRQIKNYDMDELFTLYKQIIDDYTWIKKYMFSPEDPEGRAYIDYYFDNYESNIKEFTNLIEENEKTLVRNDSNPYGGCWNINQHYNQRQDHLNTLSEFKSELSSLQSINKPREYYYVNNHELSGIVTETRHHIYYQRTVKGKWIIEQQTRLDNFLISFFEKFTDHNNKCYHGNFRPQQSWSNDDHIKSNLSSHHIVSVYKSYINHIITSSNGVRNSNYGKYYKNFTTRHFEPLMKLAKLFIEIIEFLRPDIDIKYKKLLSTE